jgi:predicted N-formylglutamate amidohydrolase
VPTVELALISCEHGGCDVPRHFRSLFRGQRALLHSHRGFDAGALDLAQTISSHLDVPLVASTTTRLLVDLNRSTDHPDVLSTFTRGLPDDRRLQLLRFHAQHRSKARTALRARLHRRALQLHVAVHSFTPVWKDRHRRVDVGLLYDPSRPFEAQLARLWQHRLRQRQPRLRVYLNAPYRGWTDGLPTTLRQCLGARYVGIELEMNQRLLRRDQRFAMQLKHDLIDSLRETMRKHAESTGRATTAT